MPLFERCLEAQRHEQLGSIQRRMGRIPLWRRAQVRRGFGCGGSGEFTTPDLKASRQDSGSETANDAGTSFSVRSGHTIPKPAPRTALIMPNSQCLIQWGSLLRKRLHPR